MRWKYFNWNYKGYFIFVFIDSVLLIAWILLYLWVKKPSYISFGQGIKTSFVIPAQSLFSETTVKTKMYYVDKLIIHLTPNLVPRESTNPENDVRWLFEVTRSLCSERQIFKFSVVVIYCKNSTWLRTQ